MATFYTFHQTFGQFGKTAELTGKFENQTLVRIGPSHNNTRPPYLYASDDWADFVSTLARALNISVPPQLRDAPLGYWPAE